MTQVDPALRMIEGYLEALGAGLRGLPHGEATDIIEELRSHIRERAEREGRLSEASVSAALQAMGRPSELAASYVAESIIARSEGSPSPWLILRNTYRWASLSLLGAFVFFGTFVGYGLGASFLLAALAKPFAPGRVGLWKSADALSLHLGFHAAPGGTEILGWWIIPVGLLVVAGCFTLTNRFAVWGLRRLRRGRPRPAAAGA